VSDNDLLKLYNTRQQALDNTASRCNPLRDMNAVDRAFIDKASATFAATDKAITAELRKRQGPARLRGVTLHLTADKLNFIPLNPKTNQPLHASAAELKKWSSVALYHYPQETR
jgi:hypothetical protein